MEILARNGLRDRRHISLLILSAFERMNELLFPLTLSEKLPKT